MARILVVDDDSAVLEHAVLCLGRDGHRVSTASNGEEGWARLCAGAFDVVVTDVYMPALGGFGLADRLRQRDGTAAPPLIFLSSIEDRANYRRAFGLRAADFLVKPVSCDVLRRSVLDRLEASALEAPPGAIAVPGFRILRRLGEGASGDVFLALDERAGRHCALKIIRLPQDPGEQESVIERFQGECTILEGIDCEGIARVYQHGVADDCLYIALEYLPGGDLVESLRSPIAPERALDEIGQVARALAAIHARGIVHRDLKPANLMRRADGTLTLVDFGIARREQHDLTSHGQVLGTPSYMSPEQFLGERVDARSDIYSLGCILFQMLTGERAFSADSYPALHAAHTTGPRPRLPEKLAYVQPVLDRMLALDREARLADGREAAEALEPLRRHVQRRRERDKALSSLDLEI
jgi:eukaryotic-like serine/threonine-protein kinase